MWQDRARCLNQNTELFYPPRRKEVYQEYADQARAFCYGRTEDEGLCPVIIECLLFALKNDEVHGIWGGLSSRERSGLRTRNVLPKWIRNYDEESVRRVQDALVRTPEEILRYEEETYGAAWESGAAPVEADE